MSALAQVCTLSKGAPWTGSSFDIVSAVVDGVLVLRSYSSPLDHSFLPVEEWSAPLKLLIGQTNRIALYLGHEHIANLWHRQVTEGGKIHLHQYWSSDVLWHGNETMFCHIKSQR